MRTGSGGFLLFTHRLLLRVCVLFAKLRFELGNSGHSVVHNRFLRYGLFVDAADQRIHRSDYVCLDRVSITFRFKLGCVFVNEIFKLSAVGE